MFPMYMRGMLASITCSGCGWGESPGGLGTRCAREDTKDEDEDEDEDEESEDDDEDEFEAPGIAEPPPPAGSSSLS